MSQQEPPDIQPCPMTRQQLYDLVWSTAMQTLAPRFGCSDSWLAKLCRSAGVPTPPRGYWAKKAAGKNTRRRPLPRQLDPEEVVLLVHTQPEPVPPPPDDPDVVAAVERASELPKNWEPDDSLRTHPLVKAARRALLPADSARRHDMYGWVTPQFGGHRNPLEIDVGEELVERALHIMNVLLKALAGQGYETSELEEQTGPGGRRPAGVYTLVLGEAFRFRLRERLRMRETDAAAKTGSGPRVSWEMTGKLELELKTSSGDRKRRWADGRRGNVESRVREILVDTIRVVQDCRRKREERRLREIARVAREKAAARQREEQRRIEALFQLTDQWQQAERLRVFVDACRDKAASVDGILHEDDREWMAWAESVAVHLNPLGAGTEGVRNATTPRTPSRTPSWE